MSSPSRRSILFPLLFSAIVIFVQGLFIGLNAQESFSWKSFASKKNVTSALYTGGNYWAATSGGAFRYNPLSGAYLDLGKSDGLSSTLMTAIAVDAYGRLWFGYATGNIDVYNPGDGSIKKIYDIALASLPKKQINSFTFVGDTAYAAFDNGVAAISARTLSFISNYAKFGALASGLSATSVFYDSVLFVATSAGLAIQKKGAVNLSAPESWTSYNEMDGLPDGTIYKIGKFRGKTIAATTRGIYSLDGSVWNRWFDNIAVDPISEFYVSGDTLYFAQNNYTTRLSRIYYYTGTDPQLISNLYFPVIASFATIGKNGFYAATEYGLLRWMTQNDSTMYYYPEGPFSNLVYDLAVDEKGTLWVASGTDRTGVGFYRYNKNGWKNFRVDVTPGLLSNAAFNVTAGKGKVYFGTWGRGYFEIANDSILTPYYLNNTPLLGIPDDSTFLVISGVEFDSRGNLWSLNYGSVNRKTLAVQTPAGKWYQYANYYDSSLSVYLKMMIDQYDTKWFLCSGERGQGLYYFNENKTFTTASDDKYGYISSLPELSGKSITSFVVDKRGDVWVGTTQGVYVVSNTSSLLGSSASLRVTSLFSLRQYSVQSIAVDAINRKWIGSNQGLLLVSADGNTLLQAFSANNSPLLSDQVRSVAVDENNGFVYAATDNGLVQIFNNIISPSSDFSALRTFPSPFVLSTGKNNRMHIDGLMRESEYKILTLTGDLVKTVVTSGGKTSEWDGRNDKGELVASGVYLLVAYDKEGNNVGVKKIAVVRQ